MKIHEHWVNGLAASTNSGLGRLAQIRALMYSYTISQKLTLAWQYRCCFPLAYQPYQEKCVQQVEISHHLPMLQEKYSELKKSILCGYSST
jgi:hypothetical protein